ncbi:methionyl-tRNA formyltransferase [Parvibaculum lavamentivorans DS-1]|uniref:Methionyl-tRNA formyltransferase n=1 Tax=Parvibaculum lavamentivorans (strain DS-1 / DSM 13023 / NCIMB 13966) TaxID=402881 RepID=FMT_PARL1|nr:methionyl-tRNA formyltransferase [Parvibaculum lavamentivorans]A7HPQ2.1 RecName: Full=Methionyl-tRNA formyltransferase [Parvibaculum lavamentivorans DS-1]ABS61885.1 methionyl-tRNA formyltransferase [Parvibaculum lavamentivorans DS-1]
MKLAFMGTPDFSVPVLAEILAAGHEVVAVYSQPPRKAGRGMAEQPSPVHRFAEEHGIPVFTPVSLKGEAEQQAFASLDLDVAVVVAYGLILPKPVLEAPRLGCLNLHASLLPRWRGAAPIQRAIMAGDAETGVMVMQMEEGLDTGPVLLAERVAIAPDETAGGLHDRLSHIGASLMVRALAALSRGGLAAAPQPEEGVTYARKIEKAEARIDWRRPANELDCHIRGLTPFPGAFFEIARGGETIRVKILRAKPVAKSGEPGKVLDAGESIIIACGEGALEISGLQRAGKAAVTARDFLRGFALKPGESVA